MQRAQVLRLFRDVLKEASRIHDYSLKEYIRRRARQDFRQNSALTNLQKITQSLGEGREQLQVIRRQRIVQNLYFSQENVLQQP